MKTRLICTIDPVQSQTELRDFLCDLLYIESSTACILIDRALPPQKVVTKYTINEILLKYGVKVDIIELNNSLLIMW